MRLEVRVPSPQTAPLIVQYGWQPLEAAAESQVVPPNAAAEGGAVVVEFSAAPCGPVWVRAGVDKDSSARWKAGDGRCEGADPQGRLRLARTAASTSERCVLVAP